MTFIDAYNNFLSTFSSMNGYGFLIDTDFNTDSRTDKTLLIKLNSDEFNSWLNFSRASLMICVRDSVNNPNRPNKSDMYSLNNQIHNFFKNNNGYTVPETSFRIVSVSIPESCIFSENQRNNAIVKYNSMHNVTYEDTNRSG